MKHNKKKQYYFFFYKKCLKVFSFIIISLRFISTLIFNNKFCNKKKPAIGVEPMTIALQVRCSDL